MRIRADALLQAVVMQQVAVLARFDFDFTRFWRLKLTHLTKSVVNRFILMKHEVSISYKNIT
jgi:hypothetical protein